MNDVSFEYTMYLAATPKKVWNALFDPALTGKYWQHKNIADWKPGSKWIHQGIGKNGTIDMVGEVVEFTAPRRLVLTWADPADETVEEKHSRVAIEVEPYHGVSKLKVTHDKLEAGSDMLKGISEGWPMVFSSLKSLMERGKALPKLW